MLFIKSIRDNKNTQMYFKLYDTLSKQKRFNRPQKLILGGLIQYICIFFSLFCAYTVPTVIAAGSAGGTIIVMMSNTRNKILSNEA